MSDQDGDRDRGYEPTESLAPTRVIAGRYRVGRLLGEGAMGAVYEGEHLELRRKVAIKLLSERLALDPLLAERARVEARATAAINHDNIVAVTDTGTDDGQPYIVMELLEGESLGAVIRREGKVGKLLACGVMYEVLSGLSAAHEQGVIHRDLKPDNIFLAQAPDGGSRAKILDFGVSKLVTAHHNLTQTGVALGTPHYMAPEQVNRSRDLDGRVDIYAAGVILYRTILGQLPFAGKRDLERDDAIADGQFPKPTEIDPDFPPGLERVILTAMATNRDDRYASAREFRDALVEVVPEAEVGLVGITTVKTLPGYVPMATGSVGRPAPYRPRKTITRRRRRKRRLVVAIAAMVVAMTTAGIAWRVSSGISTADEPSLVLGMSTYASESVQRATYQPITDYLSRRLSRRVDLVMTRDAFELRRQLSEGDLTFVALDPLSYVRAKHETPGLELLATPDTGGTTTFQVHIVVSSNSNIQSLQDLQGRAFCYVPSAASGYFIPRWMMRDAGLDPDRLVGASRLVDNHVDGLARVLGGTCEATAIYGGLLYQAKQYGMNPHQFRILATSKPIPNDAYCASPQLGPEITAELRKALLELKAGTVLARQVFPGGSEIAGFAAGSDANYDDVRAAEARALAGPEIE